MSDIAIGRADSGSIFKPATIGLMILVGVVGFFGALVLGTYAPDIEGQGSPGGHALSNSAVGYSGLVQLAAATGRKPAIVRDKRLWTGDDLVVATPTDATINLNDILTARGTKKPTLFVLPKWGVVEDSQHKGWVRTSGLLAPYEPEGVFAPGMVFAIKRHLDKMPALRTDGALPSVIRFATPAKLQVIERPSKAPTDQKPPPIQVSVAPSPEDGQPVNTFNSTYDDIVPVITDGSGGIVLGKIGNLYILADPDLLDNAAMKQPANAAAALALLDWVNSQGSRSVDFDVVLNGLGSSKSILRLAFDPPILAMTLTLAVMVVLIGIRAAGRFGAPQLRARAIAFGKTALVENGAMLVRKAGKARRLGGRYAAVIRDQAVQTFGVSARFSQPEIDRYLDGLGGAVPFTALADAAEAANNDGEMLAAARALHTWKREVVGDD
ncbi:MAG: hypothetical protein ACXWI1_05545 [Croceibacterium sp.]